MLKGGVGERRTTPSTGTVMQGVTNHDTRDQPPLTRTAAAAVEVHLEEDLKDPFSITSTVQMEGFAVAMAQNSSMMDVPSPMSGETSAKGKKPKKRVAFQSDRPDLYDF